MIKRRIALFYTISLRERRIWGDPITKRQRLSYTGRTTRRREYRKDSALSRKFGGCPSVPTGAYTAGKYAGNRKTRGL